MARLRQPTPWEARIYKGFGHPDGIIRGMNFCAELTQGDAQTSLPEWVQAQFAALESQLAERDAELKRRELKIQQLTLELAHHKRIHFGCKSETFSPEQRDLFVDCRDEDWAAIVAELEQQEAASSPRQNKRTGRNPLPPELPRIEHRHEPASCTCGECGADLVKIGEDVSEQLDVEPARFFVHRHIRPQYACRHCETVTAAPIPAAPIDGGLAAPGLHAWVLIQKYLDHLPLYRIEKISDRHGVPIARSTLAQWVGQLGVALQPLVDRLVAMLKERKVLHADETPVQQLDPGQGKTKRAYLWAYRSNDLEGAPRMVVFDYQTGHPELAGHRQAQRSGALRLAPGYLGETPGLALQSDRRTAAAGRHRQRIRHGFLRPAGCLEPGIRFRALSAARRYRPRACRSEMDRGDPVPTAHRTANRIFRCPGQPAVCWWGSAIPSASSTMSIASAAGQIVRLNDKTVTLISDGQKWRVAYALLHRVVDATAAEPIAGQIIKR